MKIPNRLHTLLRPVLLMSVISLGLLSIIATGGGGGNGNQAPTAIFSATPGSGDAPLLVQVDASGSSDSDGSISGYAWDFGNGEIGSGVTSGTTYNSTGSYTITLTITDDGGATGTATTTITVGAISGKPKDINQQFLEQYGRTMNSANHSLAYQAGEITVMGRVTSGNHSMFLIAGQTTPPDVMTNSSHVLHGGFYLETP